MKKKRNLQNKCCFIQKTRSDSLSLAPLAVQLKNLGCTSLVLFISELLTQHSFARLKAAKKKLEEEEEKLTVQVITPSDFLHSTEQVPDGELPTEIKRQLTRLEWNFDADSAFNRASKKNSVDVLKDAEKNAVNASEPNRVMMKKFLDSIPEDKKKVLIISHIEKNLKEYSEDLREHQQREIRTSLVQRPDVKKKTSLENLLQMNYPRWPGILLLVITLVGALPAITGLCCEQAAHAPDWWAQCTQWVAKKLGDNALHHTLWPASLGVAGAGLFGLAIYFLYKQSFESKKRELENAASTPPNPGAN